MFSSGGSERDDHGGTAAPGRGTDGLDNLRCFVLGRRGWAVFALLVLLGTLVWFAGSPGVTSRLFGPHLPDPTPDTAAFEFLLVPVVCGALAFVCGFASPRGFWLWGVALALHAPFTEALTIYMMYQEGLELPAAGGPGEIVGYGIFVAMLIAFAALCYTFMSALGMVLRHLAIRGPSR